MNKEQIIEKLKASQWWSTEYENFDGRSDEAKAFIANLGLAIASGAYTHNDEDVVIRGIVLIGFTEHEVNYRALNRRHVPVYEQKEAQPTWTPDLESLMTIERHNELKVSFARQQAEHDEFVRRQSEERKTKFEIEKVKFQTIIDRYPDVEHPEIELPLSSGEGRIQYRFESSSRILFSDPQAEEKLIASLEAKKKSAEEYEKNKKLTAEEKEKIVQKIKAQKKWSSVGRIYKALVENDSCFLMNKDLHIALIDKALSLPTQTVLDILAGTRRGYGRENDLITKLENV